MNTRCCIKREKSATIEKKLNTNTLMIKTMTKLGTNAKILVHTEELQVVTIVYLRKFMWFFTRHETMIVKFYHKKATKSV